MAKLDGVPWPDLPSVLVCMYMYACAYVHVCMCVYLHVSMYIGMYVCIQVGMYICMYAHNMHTHMYAYIHTYIHTYMHTYIHGVSIKAKPNCLCHICLMPDHIILKLSRYL